MWRAVCLAVLPVCGMAQDYGSTPLTQTYDTVRLDWFIGPGFSDAASTNSRIVPLDGGGYLELICAPEMPETCWTVRYTDFANASAHGNIPPDAPVSEALDMLTPIETRDRVGGPVFPLRDGAEFSWVEVWRDGEFEADYDMRLSVSCCKQAPENDIDLSEDVWTIRFSYENSGAVGDPHGGDLTYLYNEANAIIVEYYSSSWWENQGQRSLSYAKLTEFVPR